MCRMPRSRRPGRGTRPKTADPRPATRSGEKNRYWTSAGETIPYAPQVSRVPTSTLDGAFVLWRKGVQPMLRSAAILLVAWSAIGCRAPKPSFNVFAPYGSSRVPPPPTGSMGNPGAYYQPPGARPPGSQSPATNPQPSTSPTHLGTPTQPPASYPPTLGTPAQPQAAPAFMGAAREAGPPEPARPVVLTSHDTHSAQ
jgi:hypothetical protein